MVKELIKSIPGMKKILSLRHNLEYIRDRKLFFNNYMYSYPVTKEKLEYDILLEVHKLEKGFAVAKNQRPFGFEKIKRIVEIIDMYEKNQFEKSFAYNIAYSSLKSYLKFYEEKKWIDKEEYIYVQNFLSNKNDYKYIPVGAFDLKKSSFINDIMKFDYEKFSSSRRSVRNFSSKKLNDNDIKKAVEIALNTPTACNRQMCKIYFVNSSDKKKIIEKFAQGLGLFDLTNVNYFVLSFDISASYFIGERNQGWFNSGLVTMNFVNALHSLGIGSCCVQFGNSNKEEAEFKKLLNIPVSERIGVIIAAGYYDEISRIPYSTRKPISEIYRER